MKIFYCPTASKKPTVGRFFVGWWVVAALWMAAGPAYADQGLGELELMTEEEAVDSGVDWDVRSDRWMAQHRIARAETVISGAFPNPMVGYRREQLFSDRVNREETLEVEQRLPISGRRGLEAEAAQASARAVEQDMEVERSDIRLQIRKAFYELLYGQRLIEVHQRSVQRLDEAIDDMTRRVEAGESSRYELERLQRERAEFQATLEVEEASLRSRRAQLGGLIGRTPGVDPAVEADGDLLPGDVPGEEEIRDAVAARPEVAAAGHRIESAGLEGQAAGRWWIPDLFLQGGVIRDRRGGQQEFGMELGVAVGIPLFYRGQGQRDRARAAQIGAQAHQTVLEQRMYARAIGMAQEVEQLGDTTRDYGDEAVERARRVLSLAEQSYEAGESGLMALLDAHQSLLDARLRELELAARSRTRYIELQALIEHETGDQSSGQQED